MKIKRGARVSWTGVERGTGVSGLANHLELSCDKAISDFPQVESANFVPKKNRRYSSTFIPYPSKEKANLATFGRRFHACDFARVTFFAPSSRCRVSVSSIHFELARAGHGQIAGGLSIHPTVRGTETSDRGSLSRGRHPTTGAGTGPLS